MQCLCQGRLLRPRDRTDGHGWVGIPSRTNLTDASWHAWHLMQSHACSSLAWLGERRSWFQCSRWVSRECLLLVLAILVPGVSVSWLSGNRIDTVWHRVPRRLTQSSSRRGNIFQMQSGTDWRWLTYLFRTVRYCSFLLGVVDYGFFLHFCSVSCRPSGIKRYTHGMDGKGVRTPSWSLQFPNRKDGGPMVPCCLRQWSWTWTKRPSAVVSQCEKIPWQPWQLIWQLIWQKRWVVFYVKCCRMYFRMPVLYLDDFTIWLWLT